MARADRAVGAPGRDPGGAAEGLGEVSVEAPVSFPGPDPQADPRASFPRPAPHPETGSCAACLFCFAFCSVFTFPPQLPLPSSMNELTEPALEGMNRLHRPGQPLCLQPFSQEKQVIVMRLPLHAWPVGAK